MAAESPTKWILELVDKVTGPAKQIQASLKNTTNAAKELKQSAAHVQTLGNTMRANAQSSEGFWQSFAAGNLVATTISSIASAAASGVVQLGKATFSAVAFKENALIGLEVLLKSQTAAHDVYAEAEKFASITPFDTKDVIKLYQGLVTAGFSVQKNAQGISEVNALATTIGDAAAAQGMNPDAIAGITKAIGDIKNAGKLKGGELNQLANWGVGRAPIFEQLAEATGKKLTEIPDLIAAGGVDSDQAINAIVAAIGKNFGGLMSKQSTTLTGLWSTLQSRPFEILSTLGDTGAFDSLKEFIGALAEMLGPGGDAAKSIQGFVGGSLKFLFNALLGWAKNAEGKITPESLRAGIKRLSDGFNALYDKIRPAVAAFGSLINIFVEAWKGAGDGASVLSTLSTAFSYVITYVAALIRIIQFFVSFGLAVGRFGGWVTDGLIAMYDALVSAYEWFKTGAYNLGVAIYTGLVEGIQSGVVYVKDATIGLASGAYDGVKNFLGIESPSRLYKQLGLYSAQGMAHGINAGAATVEAAALNMAAPPDFAGVGASLAASGQGRNGQGRNGQGRAAPTFNITINASGNGESQVLSIKKAVLEALQEGFEDLGYELGLAPT